MSLELTNEARLLHSSERFQSAKRELLESISAASAKIKGVKSGPKSGGVSDLYTKAIQEYSQMRGRDLYYPVISSGLGSGPFLELIDGSVKYDMITGIGVHFFGHSHPAFMEEMVYSISADVMQGNLEPGIEMKELLETLLSRVGSGSRLKHGWIACSGTMVNEIALKIVRQKKTPANLVMAFNDCFSGRSTTMQEITDNPGYRQGQPVYGQVQYIPFFDPKQGLKESIDATITRMHEHLHRYPNQFATLTIELIQGEGGFRVAPREYYVRVFEEAKKAGMAIWVDEVQTFGRTGELFAYQKFGLAEYVDLVTLGKMLQSCVILFTPEYNPKPGLVAGTFSSSTTALRTAKKTIELLEQERFLGKDGKIEKLSKQFADNLERMAGKACKGFLSDIRVIGGMIAFAPFDGTLDDVKKVLKRLFDLGVVAFYCGHGPYLVRLLPPLGAMAEQDVDQVCHTIEQAILDCAKERKN